MFTGYPLLVHVDLKRNVSAPALFLWNAPGDWASPCHGILPVAGNADRQKLHSHRSYEHRIHLHHGHNACHHRWSNVRRLHWSTRARPGERAPTRTRDMHTRKDTKAIAQPSISTREWGALTDRLVAHHLQRGLWEFRMRRSIRESLARRCFTSGAVKVKPRGRVVEQPHLTNPSLSFIPAARV